MTTVAEVVKDSLQLIGRHSVAQPANDESIDLGRRALNSMLETWITQGIRLGLTPVPVPGDDLNEPADAYNAIVANLALILAPNFNATPSREVYRSANAGYAEIRKMYEAVVIPQKGVSSTLPLGQGNRYRRRTFAGPNETVDQ